MQSELGLLDIPQDVPPPLEYATGLLLTIAQKASQSHRNSQKGLHLVTRCIEILDELCLEFSEPPTDLEEMLASMEALQKLELLLLEAKLVVDQEAQVPASVDNQTNATWGGRRDALLDLLVEAHDAEFFPPDDWETSVEEVMRVDDHLWVDLAAQQLRDTDPEAAEEAERVAAELLANPLTRENAEQRNADMMRIMNIRAEADPTPPPPPPPSPPKPVPIIVEPPQPVSPIEEKSLPPPPPPEPEPEPQPEPAPEPEPVPEPVPEPAEQLAPPRPRKQNRRSRASRAAAGWSELDTGNRGVSRYSFVSNSASPRNPDQEGRPF